MAAPDGGAAASTPGVAGDTGPKPRQPPGRTLCPLARVRAVGGGPAGAAWRPGRPGTRRERTPARPRRRRRSGRTDGRRRRAPAGCGQPGASRACPGITDCTAAGPRAVTAVSEAHARSRGGLSATPAPRSRAGGSRRGTEHPARPGAGMPSCIGRSARMPATQITSPRRRRAAALLAPKAAWSSGNGATPFSARRRRTPRPRRFAPEPGSKPAATGT